MPYIKQERRHYIFDGIAVPYACKEIGELNFLITEACQVWIEKNGKNYKAINDVIGVLECAKLEFYRRLAAPYEDTKIEQNGDVYNK